MKMIGNIEIWSLHKTAFLCSNKYSASCVLKSYDWATEMKNKGRCVMSGFHSKIEKDVFEILLTGTQPIILVLARSMYKKTPSKYKSHIESGRLLIISPFPIEINVHVNCFNAHLRNEFIIENADEIVFAHIQKGGRLERIAVPEGITKRVLDLELNTFYIEDKNGSVQRRKTKSNF